MMMNNTAANQFIRLMEILADLRGENGCPWDKEQTAKSLIPYMLEETYEIIEAIESGTMPAGGNKLEGATVQLLYQWMEDGLRP